MKHNQPTLDNLTDLLNLIIRFTHVRRSILAQNIQQAQQSDYTPLDLPADEFSSLVNEALSEHLRHGRLLWRDTTHIQFAAGGTVTFTPQIDSQAEQLRQTDAEAYLDHESRLLLENEINRKVAKGLLSRRCDSAGSSLSQS